MFVFCRLWTEPSTMRTERSVKLPPALWSKLWTISPPLPPTLSSPAFPLRSALRYASVWPQCRGANIKTLNKFLNPTLISYVFDSLASSSGSCSHGAHPVSSKDDVGEFHRPDTDGTLSGCQPQRPAQVVSAGWTFENCVWLHQKAHHQHEVTPTLPEILSCVFTKTYSYLTSCLVCMCVEKMLLVRESVTMPLRCWTAASVRWIRRLWLPLVNS